MFNIPLRVKNLMKRHDSSNPDTIAKEMKLIIRYGQTPNGVNGFWRRILHRKFIGINQRVSEEWQRQAILSHEIGHILLHPGYKSYCVAGRTFYANSHKEDEADEFAAELISHSYDIEKEYVLDFLKNGWK